MHPEIISSSGVAILCPRGFKNAQVGSAVGGGGGTAGGDLLGSLVEDMGTGGGEILLRKAEGENQEEEARRREFRGKVEEIARVAAEKVRVMSQRCQQNCCEAFRTPLCSSYLPCLQAKNRKKQ